MISIWSIGTKSLWIPLDRWWLFGMTLTFFRGTKRHVNVMRTNLQEIVYMNSEPRIQRARTQQVLGLNEGLTSPGFFPLCLKKLTLDPTSATFTNLGLTRDGTMPY